jgi:NAD(P)-dependent dehydrogenase (short-subunit alcohol dehydrogenase family)
MSRTVIVTGASGGIGSAIVRELSARGFRIFAGFRNRSAQGALDVDGSITPLALDVSSDDSIRAAVRRVHAETRGRLDGVVNNAGLLIEGPVELLTRGRMREQFDVNVIGAMALTRDCLPLLRATGGRVVNVGAVTGRTAIPYLGASAASKAALAAFSDALRIEVAPFGVAVALIEPTPVKTEIFDKSARRANRAYDEFDPAVSALYRRGVEALRSSTAEGYAAPPEAVAKAVATALTVRHPRTRYPVGKRARAISGLRFLPDRFRDRLISRAVGLNAVDFNHAEP